MTILLISPKEAYITGRLLEEAAKAGVAMEAVSIQELADRRFEVDVGRYDCLYVRFCYPYFSQTIELGRKFAEAGKVVVDAAILEGDLGLGKWPLYRKMEQAGIPIPKTEWLTVAKQWHYPCIVKWKFGFGGKEVFLVRGPENLSKATDLLPAEELLLQEFIPADFEYKVITVGYQSLPVVLRFEINKKTWRPDFAKAEVVDLRNAGKGPDPSLRQVLSLAESASRLLNRELAKVDILQKGSEFYVLEVNRWPGIRSFELLCGYNVAAEFVKYLSDKRLAGI